MKLLIKRCDSSFMLSLNKYIFFDKCIKKKIQSSYFKKNFIIILRKLRKKNYIELLLYKSIALLNTLNKILKSIVFERI